MSPLVTAPLPLTARHSWTVSDFERLFEAGFFAPDARLELIEGEIWVKPFQEPADATALTLALYRLKDAFAIGYVVRTQQPLMLGESSYSEPDISVVPGTPRDCLTHPTTAELVVEISDSTLVQDQTTKAALYARAQIAEYWIMNLVDSTLEVRRQPSPMPGELLGWGYRSTQILLPGESIAPLDSPANLIGVDELLP